METGNGRLAYELFFYHNDLNWQQVAALAGFKYGSNASRAAKGYAARVGLPWEIPRDEKSAEAVALYRQLWGGQPPAYLDEPTHEAIQKTKDRMSQMTPTPPSQSQSPASNQPAWVLSGETVPFRVNTVGTKLLLDNMWESADPQQHVIEHVRNAVQHHAKNIYIGPFWPEAPEKYLWSIEDDGEGMDETTLIAYISEVFKSSKAMGLGAGLSKGVGARASLCPWNPEGVLVLTFQNGKGKMAQYGLSEDGKTYGPKLLVGPEGTSEFYVPVPKRYLLDREGNPRKNGTVVVALGDGGDHTYLGPDRTANLANGNSARARRNIKVLETRFWQFPADVNVTAFDPNNADIHLWPKSQNGRSEDRRGGQSRGVYGIRQRAEMHGLFKEWTVEVQGATIRILGLTEEALPKYKNSAGYSSTPQTTGFLYNNEVYSTQSGHHGARFDSLGIHHAIVSSRLIVVMEPHMEIADDLQRGRIILKNGQTEDSFWSEKARAAKALLPPDFWAWVDDITPPEADMSEIEEQIDKESRALAASLGLVGGGAGGGKMQFKHFVCASCGKRVKVAADTSETPECCDQMMVKPCGSSGSGGSNNRPHGSIPKAKADNTDLSATYPAEYQSKGDKYLRLRTQHPVIRNVVERMMSEEFRNEPERRERVESRVVFYGLRILTSRILHLQASAETMGWTRADLEDLWSPAALTNALMSLEYLRGHIKISVIKGSGQSE